MYFIKGSAFSTLFNSLPFLVKDYCPCRALLFGLYCFLSPTYLGHRLFPLVLAISSLATSPCFHHWLSPKHALRGSCCPCQFCPRLLVLQKICWQEGCTCSTWFSKSLWVRRFSSCLRTEDFSSCSGTTIYTDTINPDVRLAIVVIGREEQDSMGLDYYHLVRLNLGRHRLWSFITWSSVN